MIVFETQEAFEEAVMIVLRSRLVVGVAVRKENADWYGNDTHTKVKVTLFDSLTGNNIDSSEDYA